MKAREKIALLKEHAILVGAIPTMKGLDKIKALKRLSEIIVILGGRVANDEPANSVGDNISKNRPIINILNELDFDKKTDSLFVKTVKHGKSDTYTDFKITISDKVIVFDKATRKGGKYTGYDERLIPFDNLDKIKMAYDNWTNGINPKKVKSNFADDRFGVSDQRIGRFNKLFLLKDELQTLGYQYDYRLSGSYDGAFFIVPNDNNNLLFVEYNLNRGFIAEYLNQKLTIKSDDFNQVAKDIDDWASDLYSDYVFEQQEQERQDELNADEYSLTEHLNNNWVADGDMEFLQPLLDKYRDSDNYGMSTLVERIEQAHQNWLDENE